jgi:pimeloyl-ACP methyl ester carboxylesterase
MGAGSQSMLWPTEFCKRLASYGFYVIRYDHRDTGHSSMVNYDQAPYTIMEITKDALAVLDSYKIKQANIIGFSMGGEVAQFVGAYFPEKALSLTLISTSSSFKESFEAFEGKRVPDGLSAPKDNFVKWATTKRVDNNSTASEKIIDFIKTWKLLNGEKVNFDEELYFKIGKIVFTRSSRVDSYANHARAMKASYKEHKKAPNLIKVPTLIIHGTEDPVFGTDHAKKLHELIRKSELNLITNMGHALNTRFFDDIISKLAKHCKKKAK